MKLPSMRCPAPEEDRPPYVIGLITTRRSEVIADALLKRGNEPRAVEKVLGLNFIDALGRIWGRDTEDIL